MIGFIMVGTPITPKCVIFSTISKVRLKFLRGDCFHKCIIFY